MTSLPLYPALERALRECVVDSKLGQALALDRQWRSGGLERHGEPCPHLLDVGRPTRPALVPPHTLPRRKIGSREGHAALLHAIAHIEFNAVNLALDAAWRFRDMPDDFVGDWLRIAAEEAEHFGLLAGRLAALGYAYGDFAAHDGLWSMAVRTAHDPLPRMALVPRVLEARGLDATPQIQRRLASIGDAESVAVLDRILADEIGHVRVGNHWFSWLCAARGLDPLPTFRHLLAEYEAERFAAPANLGARRAAGFSEAELALLEDFANPDRESPHA